MKYIRKEEVKDAHIKHVKISSFAYDMYYVDIIMKDGTQRRIKTFCEKGTLTDSTIDRYRVDKEIYKRKLRNFFIDRLIGKDSLLVKEGRDDYIYLGTDFDKNGYIANRYPRLPNGKNGQENFDENLLKIKSEVESIEKEFEGNQRQPEDKSEGKSYVIGDIHGKYGSYMEVIRKLTPKDKLYIIGDVIDRGKGGLKIIQDIMERQNNPTQNPQITFLLGNHEWQFINSISTISKYAKNGITYEEVYYAIGDDDMGVSEKGKAQLKSKGFDEIEIENLHRWLVRNGGEYTYIDFVNLGTLEERRKICKFMQEANVVLPKRIKDRDYLLVHSAPPDNLAMIKKIKQSGQGYKYNDDELGYKELRFMLEAREKNHDDVKGAYKKAKDNGFITICGHSPISDRKILRNEEDGYIRIDTGCGHGGGKLALYCLDDDSVEYIDQKENDTKDQHQL